VNLPFDLSSRSSDRDEDK